VIERPAVGGDSPRRHVAPVRRAAVTLRGAAPSLVLVGAVALWIASLARIRVDAIGTYGLLSAFPVTMYVALAAVTVSMVWSIHRNARDVILATHVVAFVAMLHATPALRYETLRYAWAWKHLGLVDQLTREHAIAAGSSNLAIYHNWPGFFTAATSWLGSADGLGAWPGIVQWAPPFFELLAASAVYTAIQSLDADRRVVWLGVWFFVAANWIGQDYFSPQAFAFVLYLAVISIVLRMQARRPAPPRWLHNRFGRHRALEEKPATSAVPSTKVGGATVLALTCAAAIVTSHPLTPIVLLAVLVLLAVVRVLPAKRLPILVGLMEGLWLLTGARPYVSEHASSILGGVGEFRSNVDESLVRAANADTAQRVVSTLGRVEVAIVAVVAMVGLLRRLHRGRWDASAALLAVAPLVIVLGSSYGGEATFRVYLFSLPFLAFFAATACYPERRVRHRNAALAAGGLSVVFVTCTLFAYFGKEAWTHFTRAEYEAANMVLAQAPPGSLIVEGNDDFPNRFRNAENFTYVDLSAEPPASVAQVIADPVSTMSAWLGDPRYRKGYLVITRSQKAEADALGIFPKGALTWIETLVIGSDRFEVLYHDDDATVVTVRRDGGGAQ
jgi:hypothetical protein